MVHLSVGHLAIFIVFFCGRGALPQRQIRHSIWNAQEQSGLFFGNMLIILVHFECGRARLTCFPANSPLKVPATNQPKIKYVYRLWPRMHILTMAKYGMVWYGMASYRYKVTGFFGPRAPAAQAAAFWSCNAYLDQDKNYVWSEISLTTKCFMCAILNAAI